MTRGRASGRSCPDGVLGVLFSQMGTSVTWLIGVLGALVLLGIGVLIGAVPSDDDATDTATEDLEASARSSRAQSEQRVRWTRARAPCRRRC